MDPNAEAPLNGSNKPAGATYRQIPEADMEEQAVLLSKNTPKPPVKTAEPDGADEKMLPDEDTKVNENSKIKVADVKFISDEKQNGDAKVDIGELRNTFVGMGKEELMKYANDPFWIRLRWFLFIAFWLLWAGMLVGAILIIVAAPKCAPPEPKTWWEQGPLTEIEVDTTQDTLKQLKENGVLGVIVTYPQDTYDPLNNSKDFLNFLQKAKETDVNVIVELEPRATNKWFKHSEMKVAPYEHYYIWASAKGSNASGNPIPPNNWVSKRNDSSWIYSEKRHQFFLAPDGVPQLNFRNQNVVNEFTNVLNEFLAAGVKGIRLRGAAQLLINPDLKDEGLASAPGFTHTDYGFYTHTKTEYLEDLGPLLKKWRDLMKDKTDNGPFMLTEEARRLEAFRANGTLVVDLPRRSRLFSANKQLSALQINTDLEETFAVIGRPLWPLWQHNTTVLPQDVLDIIVMLLPGSSLINKNHVVDPELIKLRNSPSFMYGSTARYLVANKTVFSYIRVKSGNPGYVVALNPTNKPVLVDFRAEIPEVSEEVTVQFLSKNYNETGIDVKLKANSQKIPLSPESAIVLSYVPKSEA